MDGRTGVRTDGQMYRSTDRPTDRTILWLLASLLVASRLKSIIVFMITIVVVVVVVVVGVVGVVVVDVVVVVVAL